MLFLAWLDVSDLYLFHLIVLLTSVFVFVWDLAVIFSWKSNNNFVSIILKVASVTGAIATTAGLTLGSAALFIKSVNAQFLDQVKIKDTSQLINDISRAL